jgi:hypothetical protein
MARIGKGQTGDWRIPKDGYPAVRNAFTGDKPDKSKVYPTLSIAFGIRWLGHKIQNSDGNRAKGIMSYNGGGFNRSHSTGPYDGSKYDQDNRPANTSETDGYVSYVRRIMESPEDYIDGKIPKKVAE